MLDERVPSERATMALDTIALAPRTLAGLAHQPWPDALANVEAIVAALSGCDEAGPLEAIAAALPRTLAELAPELGLALARLALALADHRPRVPDDVERAEPALRVAWLRVRLTGLLDAAALDAIDDDELAAALASGSGWSLLDVREPLALLLRLARAEDAELRASVPSRLGALLDALALRGEQALACLRPLVDSDPRSRLALVRALREPSFAALVHDERQGMIELVERLLLDAAPPLLGALLPLARELGLRDRLAELALDDAQPWPARELALVELGPIAGDDELALALELCADEPLALGPALRKLLLEAHRHGAFVRAHQLDALIDAYDRHLAWTGAELVRVAYLVRDELIDRLAELPADDPRWLRRAAILAAAPGTRAATLCATLLRRTREPAIAAALADAGAHLPEFDDEAALLHWFDRIPEALLSAMRVKGGAATFARLRALVLDPCTPAGLRPRALATAWALCDEREAFQRELCVALGPWDSGLLDPTHARVGDDRMVTLALSPPWPDRPEHRLEPRDLLHRLCSSGDLRLLPRVTATYRSCVEAVVRAALAGNFTIKRTDLPALEQELYRYGRALLAEGRVVRHHLAAEPETGRDLVLAIVIAWLHEQPSKPILVALLETLGRHDPSGPALQQMLGYWRHRDADMQRAAIEALIAGSVEPVRGLELSLSRLAAADDARVARQALAAIGHFEAVWAEPLLLDALRRHEMAVKKEAAAALERLASAQAIPVLVHWLARHDNEAFRASLLAALEHAAGSSAMALLVEAHERAEDARSRELLSDALDARISIAAALRLARREDAGARALVDALLSGRLRLREGSSESLAAALRRAKLRPTTTREDPTRRLRVEGFSPAAAIELLAAATPDHEPALLGLIGASLADWLRWLEQDAAAPSTALEWIVRAIKPSHAEQLDRVLALLEARGVAAISSAALLALLSGCLVPERDARRKARGLVLLRAKPPEPELGGYARHRLIHQLGGVYTPDDLDACLRACQLGPDLPGESARVLFEAFAIPDEQPDELQRFGEARARRRAELRDRARSWHRLSPPDARAWLVDMLARRPLGVPIPARPPLERKPTFVPRTREDLGRLLAALHDADAQQRERVATLLSGWPDAHASAGPAMLDAYLEGRIALADRGQLLAARLVAWPSAPAARVRARALIAELDSHQLRRFLPEWIAALHAEDPDATECLRRVSNEHLIPLAREHARRGQLQLVALLRPDGSLALRTLVDELRDSHPDAIAHLLPREDPSEAPSGDPLEGRSLEQLVELAEDRSTKIDLAVRAIHEIVEQGHAAAVALAPFTLDRRPRVRSAALRTYRSLVSRTQGLDTIVQVLGIETRDDVIVSLLASLAHARHAPGLPVILDYLVHRSTKLRDGAESALLAWGPEVLPSLRRAAAKARPDHARVIATMIARLEGDA